jgi:pyrroloquinoline quinone (PQQ) biosynthesis protein C
MNLDYLKTQIEPSRKKVIEHPLYSQLQSIEDIRLFTSYHVYAVWDFMSLLKGLQQKLTCTDVPWVPVGNPETRFLINEIVVGEESDVDQEGNRASHFELYLKCMEQLGASLETIEQFINAIRNGISVEAALNLSNVPSAAQQFVRYTFQTIREGQLHKMAAIFTFGREDLIPDMFIRMVKDLNKDYPAETSMLLYYLERHIEVDGDHHSHLSMAMVQELCGNDERKWKEATEAAIQGLEQRYELWQSISKQLQKQAV